MCRYLVVLQRACMRACILTCMKIHTCIQKWQRAGSNRRCKAQILRKYSNGDWNLFLHRPYPTHSHVTSRSSSSICILDQFLCTCLHLWIFCVVVCIYIPLYVYVWLCLYEICVVLRNKRSIALSYIHYIVKGDHSYCRSCSCIDSIFLTLAFCFPSVVPIDRCSKTSSDCDRCEPICTWHCFRSDTYYLCYCDK